MEAPLSDHKKILLSPDDMFKFKEFGAHEIDFTRSFCWMIELRVHLTRSQIQIKEGHCSLTVAIYTLSQLTEI